MVTLDWFRYSVIQFLNFLESATLDYSCEGLLICCLYLFLAVSIVFSLCSKHASIPCCFNSFSRLWDFLQDLLLWISCCFLYFMVTLLDARASVFNSSVYRRARFYVVSAMIPSFTQYFSDCRSLYSRCVMGCNSSKFNDLVNKEYVPSIFLFFFYP